MEKIIKIHLATLRKHDKLNDIPRKIVRLQDKTYRNLEKSSQPFKLPS